MSWKALFLQENIGRLTRDKTRSDALCSMSEGALDKEMGAFGHDTALCTKMHLWEYSDQFFIEPVDGGPHQSLVIDRTNGDIQLIGKLPRLHGAQLLQSLTIYGVIGVIRLLAGTYILVITGRDCVGSYHGCSVFRITSMKFISCDSSITILSTQEKKDEAHFVTLLKTVESTSGLYFSYETDLTLSSQRTYDVLEARKLQPLWKQVDPRFVWNHHLLEELIEHKLEPYIIPVLQGSFRASEIYVRDTKMWITIISRRCNRRIGTRMWRRGADLEGYVANFVETEQILEVNGYSASYVQVRGSIPVLWEQIVDLTYKPKPNLLNLEDSPKVLKCHFKDLEQRYGTILVLDLVNQHGSEGILSDAYRSALDAGVNGSVSCRYVQFDFHRICGHIHFEHLSLLYEQIAEDLKQQDYLLIDSNGRKIQEQKGVARTNCIDCLDRTNVTQSLLGRKALEAQLQQIHVFESYEKITQHVFFDQTFKILWADHGDDISIQYSGTPALKGDFVRYGRRTLPGFLWDGFNALARYYLNNFHDGIRQDAMDLVAGRYTVSRQNPSPFLLNGFESLAYLPVATAIIVAGATFTATSLWQVGENIQQFLSTVVWAGLTTGVIAIVRANGRQFCSRPRLCG